MNIRSVLASAAIGAAIVAELAVMSVIAYGSGDRPLETVAVGDGEVVIEVADQEVYGALKVTRVLTPIDGWAIVRAEGGDGAPAELIGAAPVAEGENRDIAVALDASRPLPSAAFVSVVADRGALGEFEYITGSPADTFSLEGGGGMMGGPADDAPVMTESMDWVLSHDGAIVAERFTITPFRVTYRLPEANIGSAYLNDSRSAAEVFAVDAPAESWVVIIRVGRGGDDDNEVIGSALVPPGRTETLSVPISPVTDGSEVSALLVADLGATGVLEIDATDPPRSIDAPYIVRSWFVWKRVAPAQ